MKEREVKYHSMFPVTDVHIKFYTENTTTTITPLCQFIGTHPIYTSSFFGAH